MTHTVEGEWLWGDELDAVVAAPNSHRVVFENDQVRVLEVTLAPGVQRAGAHAPLAERDDDRRAGADPLPHR
jgi:hypothetical protein